MDGRTVAKDQNGGINFTCVCCSSSTGKSTTATVYYMIDYRYVQIPTVHWYVQHNTIAAQKASIREESSRKESAMSAK